MAKAPAPVHQTTDPRRQIADMRRTWRDFEMRVRRGAVHWLGSLSPSPESRRYRVEVVAHHSRPPKVWVRDPRIPRSTPHIYGDGSLCLYWPRLWRWTRGGSIAFDILPWACLWLDYYERWQVTGEWLGPSSHEPLADEEEKAEE